MTLVLTVFAIALVLIIVWPKRVRGKPPATGSAPAASMAAPAATRRPARRGGEPPSQAGAHHWTSNHFDFEVVGESFYQTQIAALVRQGGVHQVARLVLDSGNPHDNLAVRVDIDGQTVGHLSRDDARSFRRRLGAIKRTGQTTTCDAEIRGGGTARDGRTLSYGVFLAMKEFG